MRFAASPGFQNAMDAISGNSVDYSALTGMGQKARSLQKQTAFDSEAKLKSSEEAARALIEAAEYGAQATRAQGEAAGNAAMVSGIASGISGLAGGLGGMGGGGGGGGFASLGMGSASDILTNPNIPQTFAPTMSTNFATSSFLR